jgi:site-specific DNA recombinase
MTTRTAAVYARQSIDVAEGVDRQVQQCRALIEARGWTVGAILRDNETSASAWSSSTRSPAR